MATKSHFDMFIPANESNLYEDLLIEMIQERGIDVTYIPRQILAYDDIINESLGNRFTQSHTIEMYVEFDDTHEPDNSIMQKFGIFNQSTMRLTVSKSRFRNVIPNEQLELPGRPNEGDLVFIPYVSKFLEVKRVNLYDGFLTGGQHYLFSLELEPYKYGNEDFNLEDFGTISNEDKEIMDMIDSVDKSVMEDSEITSDDEDTYITDKSIITSDNTLTINNSIITVDSGLSVDDTSQTFGSFYEYSNSDDELKRLNDSDRLSDNKVMQDWTEENLIIHDDKDPFNFGKY